MRGYRLLWALAFVLAVAGCDKGQPRPMGDESPRTTKQKDSRKEPAMGVTLQWLGHASFRISGAGKVVYIDPWKLKGSPHDATVVLVSHSHYDHYSAEDIEKVSGAATKLFASNDVVAKQGAAQAMMPGLTVEVGDLRLTGVAAYNPHKKFHPKANNWLGFIVEIASLRIYYAGDTDITEEMKALKDIDVALLPVGGTYTLNATEAAEATKYLKPKYAVPYHWGDIVGSEQDAKEFARLAGCEVKLLHPGESVEF